MLENQFFPTPEAVVWKMRGAIKNRQDIRRVLDPSAGNGALLASFVDNQSWPRQKVYAIEIDQDLRYVLGEKKITVIGSDFLTYTEPTKFDLIMMNPPFAAGAEHFLKAWELVDDGGQIICLLNKQTLDDSFSKSRQLIHTIIEQFGGTVTDLGQCFKSAERPTSVYVVMVSICRPKKDKSKIFEGLNVEMEDLQSEDFLAAPLANPQPIKNLVARYKIAEQLLQEQCLIDQKLNFYLSDISSAVCGSLDKEQIDSSRYNTLSFSEQLHILKSRFWNTVFAKTKIGSRTTSKFRDDFHKFAIDQAAMAFTENNVMEVLGLFINNNQQIMQDCLVEVFDRATAYHEKNKIHHEGWKTNKSYKVGKRIIIPSAVTYEDVWGFRFSYYRDCRSFLDDLDKVLLWATNIETDKGLSAAINTHVSSINGQKGFDKIDYQSWGESTYFKFRVFKKGTVWLDFKDSQVMDAFNRKAAEGKKWIGGDY
jgi:16S rRNA A1518/A1519 N6-dimethyltransferase RsmA/KsgA/DIM1 with predicted DNA glycosylase/AP lyase activity